VPVSVVTRIECDCSELSDMTELIPILNSVRTSNVILQRRRVPFSVVNSIDSDCREQGDMTEVTPIMNSEHMYNSAC
jgi:hypothetical protein